jgi:hypothetical protein
MSVPDLKPFRPEPRSRPQSIVTCRRHISTSGQDWYGGESPKSYNSDTDEMSEKNLMGKACDIWFEAWHKGICLTPPYMSMKNWYRRLHLDGPHEEEADEDHDEIYPVGAVESGPDFIWDEAE